MAGRCRRRSQGCAIARMTRGESESRHRMGGRTRRRSSRAVREKSRQNREEVDHGPQGEEVEIEEEGQESSAEEEIRGATLRSQEKISRKEKESCPEESRGEE